MSASERRYGVDRMTQERFYLEPEQHDRLKKLSWHTRVTMSFYVREAIDLVLEKHEP